MEHIRIAIDAMGGDNAPAAPVQAAAEALSRSDKIELLLVGQEEVLREELKKFSYDEARLHIVPASEVIETGEPPVAAIRRKRDSSLVIAQRMLRNKEADALISAGSTGAVLAGGQLIVGRLPGVERAPLAVIIPTLKGVSLLIDCGANVDARTEHLLQFARMGHLYMKEVIGVKDPSVALMNIGAEEEKGNALTKETYQALKALPGIRFIGNVESREIPEGAADVIVCEAFMGNIFLKTYEGTAATLLGMVKKTMMSSIKTKIGALLIKKELKESLKAMDAGNYGGAPMLGLNGLVVKTHGNATHKEITNAVLQCVSFCEQDLTEKIRSSIAAMQKEENNGD